MQIQNALINYLEQIINEFPIISISGESGTGKTSLALYLVGNLIQDPNCCIWIQASESFPRARLETMFQKNEYVLQNTYIAPKKVIPSYSDQSLFFSTFIGSFSPPDLRIIIIDNISHHLRYELTTKSGINKKVSLMDEFYETIIYPLILKCQRESVILILLHEVTYDVATQQNRPFFYKLYDRIMSLNITLHKSLHSKERTMDIATGNKTVSLGFTLCDDGFYY